MDSASLDWVEFNPRLNYFFICSSSASPYVLQRHSDISLGRFFNEPDGDLQGQQVDPPEGHRQEGQLRRQGYHLLRQRVRKLPDCRQNR